VASGRLRAYPSRRRGPCSGCRACAASPPMGERRHKARAVLRVHVSPPLLRLRELAASGDDLAGRRHAQPASARLARARPRARRRTEVSRPARGRRRRAPCRAHSPPATLACAARHPRRTRLRERFQRMRVRVENASVTDATEEYGVSRRLLLARGRAVIATVIAARTAEHDEEHGAEAKATVSCRHTTWSRRAARSRPRPARQR
jgi:hypothetical protein